VADWAGDTASARVLDLRTPWPQPRGRTRIRARVELNAGSERRAYEAAKAYLEAGGKDERVTKYRDEAIARAQEWLKSLSK
jgi:hypothetical protein